MQNENTPRKIYFMGEKFIVRITEHVNCSEVN